MSEAANAQQEEYWNEVAGPRWVALQEPLDAQLAGLGTAVLDAAALRPGERVVDVGCGCGATSLGAARRVAPAGTVLGLDLSGPMLALARERAGETSGVRFEQVDVQEHSLPAASADVVVSRFGVMFFSAPETAFDRLRQALVPGGRLAFVCWQALERNPWMAAPIRAVASVVPLPEPAGPEAPGPFAFADAGRVERILAAAGFTDVASEALEGTLPVGAARTVEEAGDFVVEMGPAGRALREAGADASLRARAAQASAEALRPYASADGVHAPYAAWIVTARAPR